MFFPGILVSESIDLPFISIAKAKFPRNASSSSQMIFEKLWDISILKLNLIGSKSLFESTTGQWIHQPFPIISISCLSIHGYSSKTCYLIFPSSCVSSAFFYHPLVVIMLI